MGKSLSRVGADIPAENAASYRRAALRAAPRGSRRLFLRVPPLGLWEIFDACDVEHGNRLTLSGSLADRLALPTKTLPLVPHANSGCGTLVRGSIAEVKSKWTERLRTQTLLDFFRGDHAQQCLPIMRPGAASRNVGSLRPRRVAPNQFSPSAPRFQKLEERELERLRGRELDVADAEALARVANRGEVLA